MARNSMNLMDFVGKLLGEEDVDILREGIRVVAEALMDAEVSSSIGAAPFERTDDRTAFRNGYRERRWDTRLGTVDLRIPKITPGSYFPSILHPRRRAEQALAAVVQEAYINGVSTRKVDELVQALGIEGISKSQVSRICKDLDRAVEAFRSRPIDGAFPYVWLDATYHKVRQNGRVASMATVVAVGCSADGHRTILGVDAGPAESKAFWTQFLRSLIARGLHGVRLVISDAHQGLRDAISKVLGEASWQRWRVHFMRNLLALVPRAHQETVAAIVRTIFAQPAQPDHAEAMAQLRRVAKTLRGRFSQAVELLEGAAEDILAFMHFPAEHRRRLHSTNPLERLNKEIKRRTHVVGIFPDRSSLLRLVGMLLVEQDDEWQIVDRRYFSIDSMKLVDVGGGEPKELLAVSA